MLSPWRIFFSWKIANNKKNCVSLVSPIQLFSLERRELPEVITYPLTKKYERNTYETNPIFFSVQRSEQRSRYRESDTDRVT